MKKVLVSFACFLIVMLCALALAEMTGCSPAYADPTGNVGLGGNGNFVRKSGDTMSGTLKFSKVGADIIIPSNGWITFDGDPDACGTASGGACVYYNSGQLNFYIGSTGIWQFNGATTAFLNAPVIATGYVRSVGVSTGSLPACGAGIAGAMEYDQTRRDLVRCNQTAWDVLLPQAETSIQAGGYSSSASAATHTVFDTTILEPITVDNVYVAGDGTDGSGAGTYTIRVQDQTAASTLCTTSAINCTGGSSGVKACTGSSTVASHRYTIDVQCGSCTTCPLRNFGMMYHPNY